MQIKNLNVESKVIRLTLLLLCVLLSFASIAKTSTVYVSPDGNDSNTGSFEQPFATIRQAVGFVVANRLNNTEIILREGVYVQKTTIVLENLPENLTIKAYQNEKVYIVGGQKIKGFKPVNKQSPVYKRLPVRARSHIFQINLKESGITGYGAISRRGFGQPIKPSGLMLYFNGQPMTIARWPNNGWVRIKSIPEKLNGKGFSYLGDRPDRWKDATDIWMHGYWKWDWSDNYVKIEKIDHKKKEIVVADPQSGYPYTKDKRYYVFNLIEELDAPGEWYLDRETGMLYFYPPSEINSGETYVSLLEKPLVRIENCSGVILKDLIFEYSNGAGVEILAGKNNVVRNCTLRNFGTVAINIGNIDAGSKIYKNTLYNGNAGTMNGVSGCEMYNLGEGGIILGGGDRKTLTPGNNFVENCKISKASEWVRTYRAAIYMYGVGNLVRHNEISDLPHTAIFFWGNDHTIEFNNIYAVCKETADAGAIYYGRDWTQRGTVIRYNYIHHLRGVETTGTFNDVMGVYLDDFASGTTVFGNVFYKAGRNILVGGGRDNVIQNNIFIEGQPAVHIDSRGIGWAKYYFDKEKARILYSRFDTVNARKPPYSEKYPELVTLLNDEPALAKNNCIEQNIFCGGKWRDLKNNLNDSIVCFKNNKVVKECDFYILSGNRIKINPESEIFPNGFKKIPVEKIGIIND